MQASTKIVLEKHRVNNNGYSAVKLRVIHNRKSRYFSIRQYLKNDSWNYSDEKEFEKIMKSYRGERKDIRKDYERIERKANDIINDLSLFSFDTFGVKFLNKVSNWDYVFHAFTEQINSLKSDDRIGYASSINATLTGIKYFMEGKPFNEARKIKSKDHAKFKRVKGLMFSDITPSWLKNYEKFLIKNGKSTSTVGIHTRNIRTLFNIAIKLHGCKASYPFDQFKPKTSSSNKRALNIEQINSIASCQAPKDTPTAFARDMFVFSFLANGMNITDIFRLKFKNISSDELSFVRFKTKNKSTEVKVTVPLTNTLRKIIERHGNKAISDGVYVFPVCDGLSDEETIYKRIRQKNKRINYFLKKIANEVGMEKELANGLSTYHARHSFATIQKNAGESIEFIKESLGHASSATTERYLSSFGEGHRARAAKRLEDKLNIA